MANAHLVLKNKKLTKFATEIESLFVTENLLVAIVIIYYGWRHDYLLERLFVYARIERAPRTPLSSGQ